MAEITAAEISEIIKRQIEGYVSAVELAETGSVITVGDGIARIYGLEKCMAGELLEFPHDIYGMALNLEEDNVGAVLLGSDTEIKEGDEVRRTGRIMEVPVGEALIGRVVNALGQPIDGKGPIDTKVSSPIERLAPGVVDRLPVNQPLQTGLKAIDSMVPIGRGQRELSVRGTGDPALPRAPAVHGDSRAHGGGARSAHLVARRQLERHHLCLGDRLRDRHLQRPCRSRRRPKARPPTRPATPSAP